MPKRGQITLFVIIGIIIIVLAIILILIFSRRVERISREEIVSTLSLTSTINNVNNLVNLCFRELTDSVIYEAGKHGGYAALDSNFWRELPESDRWGAEDHPQYMPLVYLKCGS